MAKKRVFVSFDFDNDKILKEFIVGQAKLPDSPFEVIDTSLKEEAPMKTWEDKARAAIQRSDMVVVMVGRSTHKAPGVLKEVQMSRDAQIPIVQVRLLIWFPFSRPVLQVMPATVCSGGGRSSRVAVGGSAIGGHRATFLDAVYESM